MKPYPLELRQRIVEAVDQQLSTIEEIAGIFQVHSSYVYKLLRQRRATKELAPLPHGGGASPKLESADREVLVDLVTQIRTANRSILGCMMESNLRAGNQPLTSGGDGLAYGVSITDACVDWETTERCLLAASAQLP